MLAMFWGMTLFMISVSGGIRRFHNIFFVSGTVAAGIIAGRKFSVIYGGVSAATTLVFALASLSGYQFPSIFTYPPLTLWVIIGLNLIIIVIPLQVTLSSLSDTIKRASASEERYRLISSVVSDYAFSTQYGADGEIIDQWIGGAFEEITGYPAEEFNERGGWASIVHLDDVAQDSQDLAHLRANRDVVTEVRIIRKDGEIRWVRVYAHPKWDIKTDLLVGVFGAVQDITSQREMETGLRQREAILESVAISAELLFSAPNWRAQVDTLLKRLGETINATHAYYFENHYSKDGRLFMTMLHEWTATGFESDLNDPLYTNVIVD